jgi:hypothetical protein
MQVEPERALEFLAKLGADAEAEAFQAEKKTATVQAAMDAGDSDPDSWRTVADKTVEFSAGAICPAWELTNDEKGQLSAAVAEVLDHYFPGALQGFDRWHPLSKLAGTMFYVAVLRFDFETGRMAPLRKKEQADGSGASRGRPADSDGGAESLGQNAGYFTVGAG